eukprot:53904_1
MSSSSSSYKYSKDGWHYNDSDVSGLHRRYFLQLTLYQIMIAIQLGLIISTIIKFGQASKGKQLSDAEKRTKNRLKRLFITVLSLGSLVFILVEWYGLADFLYDFAKYRNYCDVAAILGNLSIMSYLLALYLFFLYRLDATFKNSAMELSRTHVTTLLVITFGTYFVMVVLVFVFQKGAVKHTPFAWSMKRQDYKWIIICDGEFSIGIEPTLRWLLQAIVIVGNTYYGLIFYKKLYDLLIFMQSQQDQRTPQSNNLQGIVKLMNKQATLIMVSTISTSVLWSLANVLHYFGSFLQVLIYLDITINCFCLFLMFSWNHALYKKLCAPFALVNRFCCSRIIGSEVLIQLDKSIEANHSKSTPAPSDKYQLHFHSYHDETTGSKDAAASNGSAQPPSKDMSTATATV